MAALLVIPLLAGLLATTSSDDGGPSPQETVGTLARHSDLPPVQLDELPAEAIETLTLIAQNGPFPHDRDGAVFQNREGILPQQPQGWYHEYTVPTPGSDDRGARRFVVGQADDIYYTDDHYESFRELVLG
jgi:ribonuclease T1